MTFVVNFYDGYEVSVVMPDDHGYLKQYPLRNFGDRQGDARMFKEVDCPKLTEAQLKGLIKQFDRNVKYERINGRKFIREKKGGHND